MSLHQEALSQVALPESVGSCSWGMKVLLVVACKFCQHTLALRASCVISKQGVSYTANFVSISACPLLAKTGSTFV